MFFNVFLIVKKLKNKIFGEGVEGIFPLQAVCGHTQTLLARIVTTLTLTPKQTD